jgi:Polyketide cyclase / dehydrase and lipid transport
MSAQPLTQVRSFRLNAPLAQVFPLFTALGEREWTLDWDPELLSGAEERGTVFRTKNSDGQETVWIVTEYLPAEGLVSYARLAHGSNIGLVDVICTERPGGGTDVSVRYTLTALSEDAQPFVHDFLNSKQYSRMLDEWQAATSAAVARTSTGK